MRRTDNDLGLGIETLSFCFMPVSIVPLGFWLFVIFDGLPDDLDNAPTAVEGLTQALSQEIDPNWNIKVSRHFEHMHITLK